MDFFWTRTATIRPGMETEAGEWVNAFAESLTKTVSDQVLLFNPTTGLPRVQLAVRHDGQTILLSTDEKWQNERWDEFFTDIADDLCELRYFPKKTLITTEHKR